MTREAFDEFLAEIEEYLNGRADADGTADGYKPNRAMQLMVEARGWRDTLKRQSESDQRDAERYRFLRDSPNAYPLFFIAQRDPNNIVVQFQGELADLNIDEMLRSSSAQKG